MVLTAADLLWHGKKASLAVRFYLETARSSLHRQREKGQELCAIEPLTNQRYGSGSEDSRNEGQRPQMPVLPLPHDQQY